MNFFDFIKNSKTCYHTVDTIKNELLQNGFLDIAELNYQVEYGKKYFIIKNDASIIAFTIPQKTIDGFHIIASHNDSPSFRIKPKQINSAPYQKVSTEPYGGSIYSTWLDRKISFAGRVFYEEDTVLKSKLVDFDELTFVIPNLAIHLNREINSQCSYNPQIDLQLLLGLSDDFGTILNKKVQDVIDYDLFLYNKEDGCYAGAKSELILAPRIDDLGCVYSSLQAFLSSESSKNVNVLAVFNNEEVGSRSNNGADSTFLEDVLTIILESLNLTKERYKILESSMIVSADNAHAIHPNRPEKSDPVNNVVLNKGVVLKYAANLSYTTDAFSAAYLKMLAKQAAVPIQEYTNRSDLRGGGTLGSISLNHLSIHSVDIGLPQLAMHSTLETCGSADFAAMEKLLTFFYKQ